MLSHLEEFANRVYQKAWLQAIESDNRLIDIPELDEILRQEPEFEMESLPMNFLEDAVGAIETWLEQAGVAAWTESNYINELAKAELDYGC